MDVGKGIVGQRLVTLRSTKWAAVFILEARRSSTIARAFQKL